MTNYPESYLARELEMCYVNISLITDYDVGLEGQNGIKPVSHHEVIEVFNRNNERVKNAIFKIIENVPDEHTCSCGSALSGARA
jgi:5'-methylthioadenosine phosphorylase